MIILFLFWVGALAERLFYIITVITADGEALGDGRNYNTYYVKIALGVVLALGFSSCFLEWKYCSFIFLFYERWGWENKTGK